MPCYFDGEVLVRVPVPRPQDIAGCRRQAKVARGVGREERSGLRRGEPWAALAELVPQPEFCLQELEVKEGRLD